MFIMADSAPASDPPSCQPTPGVKYPLKVDYCPKCSLPFEYVEYHPRFEESKKWMAENMPDMFAKLGLGEAPAPGGANGGGGAKGGDAEGGGGGGGGEEDGKKRQTRGGKGMVKAKKKDKEVERRVLLSIAPRGKRKAVTVVQGLKTFGEWETSYSNGGLGDNVFLYFRHRPEGGVQILRAEVRVRRIHHRRRRNCHSSKQPFIRFPNHDLLMSSFYFEFRATARTIFSTSFPRSGLRWTRTSSRT